MNELYRELKKFGTVKLNEPMARHTTFRVGGPADFFVTVDTTDALVGLFQLLDAMGAPYVLLGGGSNMLVRDEGYRGVVVRIMSHELRITDGKIVADAGCVTADVAQKAIAAGLTGFEWGVGVPGTIGGAVRGNAGAMGGEMKDVVKEVEVYQDGEVLNRSNAECRFGYRDSIFKHAGGRVLRATLSLQKGENIEGRKKALAYLAYRAKTQPPGQSMGCVFKNYELTNHESQITNHEIPKEFLEKKKISAGWLIDQAGLKGASIGDAEVATKHCNFILNNGKATAADVLALIDKIKTAVYDRFGVELKEEIQVV